MSSLDFLAALNTLTNPELINALAQCGLHLPPPVVPAVAATALFQKMVTPNQFHDILFRCGYYKAASVQASTGNYTQPPPAAATYPRQFWEALEYKLCALTPFQLAALIKSEPPYIGGTTARDLINSYKNRNLSSNQILKKLETLLGPYSIRELEYVLEFPGAHKIDDPFWKSMELFFIMIPVETLRSIAARFGIYSTASTYVVAAKLQNMYCDPVDIAKFLYDNPSLSTAGMNIATIFKENNIPIPSFGLPSPVPMREISLSVVKIDLIKILSKIPNATLVSLLSVAEIHLPGTVTPERAATSLIEKNVASSKLCSMFEALGLNSSATLIQGLAGDQDIVAKSNAVFGIKAVAPSHGSGMHAVRQQVETTGYARCIDDGASSSSVGVPSGQMQVEDVKPFYKHAELVLSNLARDQLAAVMSTLETKYGPSIDGVGLRYAISTGRLHPSDITEALHEARLFRHERYLKKLFQTFVRANGDTRPNFEVPSAVAGFGNVINDDKDSIYTRGAEARARAKIRAERGDDSPIKPKTITQLLKGASANKHIMGADLADCFWAGLAAEYEAMPPKAFEYIKDQECSSASNGQELAKLFRGIKAGSRRFHADIGEVGYPEHQKRIVDLIHANVINPIALMTDNYFWKCLKGVLKGLERHQLEQFVALQKIYLPFAAKGVVNASTIKRMITAFKQTTPPGLIVAQLDQCALHDAASRVEQHYVASDRLATFWFELSQILSKLSKQQWADLGRFTKLFSPDVPAMALVYVRERADSIYPIFTFLSSRNIQPAFDAFVKLVHDTPVSILNLVNLESKISGAGTGSRAAIISHHIPSAEDAFMNHLDFDGWKAVGSVLRADYVHVVEDLSTLFGNTESYPPIESLIMRFTSGRVTVVDMVNHLTDYGHPSTAKEIMLIAKARLRITHYWKGLESMLAEATPAFRVKLAKKIFGPSIKTPGGDYAAINLCNGMRQVHFFASDVRDHLVKRGSLEMAVHFCTHIAFDFPILSVAGIQEKYVFSAPIDFPLTEKKKTTSSSSSSSSSSPSETKKTSSSLSSSPKNVKKASPETEEREGMSARTSPPASISSIGARIMNSMTSAPSPAAKASLKAQAEDARAEFVKKGDASSLQDDTPLSCSSLSVSSSAASLIRAAPGTSSTFVTEAAFWRRLNHMCNHYEPQSKLMLFFPLFGAPGFGPITNISFSELKKYTPYHILNTLRKNKYHIEAFELEFLLENDRFFKDLQHLIDRMSIDLDAWGKEFNTVFLKDKNELAVQLRACNALPTRIIQVLSKSGNSTYAENVDMLLQRDPEAEKPFWIKLASTLSTVSDDFYTALCDEFQLDPENDLAAQLKDIVVLPRQIVNRFVDNGYTNAGIALLNTLPEFSPVDISSPPINAKNLPSGDDPSFRLLPSAAGAEQKPASPASVPIVKKEVLEDDDSPVFDDRIEAIFKERSIILSPGQRRQLRDLQFDISSISEIIPQDFIDIGLTPFAANKIYTSLKNLHASMSSLSSLSDDN